jgi:hypothetical protein
MFPSASGSHRQNPSGSEPSPSTLLHMQCLCLDPVSQDWRKPWETIKWSLNWSEFGILEDIHLSRGCDCHTVLYIVVTPGHSKSLRQELGQVLMTTYGLLHKGGKCCHGSQRYHRLNVIFHLTLSPVLSVQHHNHSS